MRWGTCNPEQKTDVFVVWNAEQERASAVIQRKFKSIKGMEGKLKKTVLKGRQHHVERRLWDTTPESATIGELAGLPGMNEEVYTAYAGPLPQKRKHHLSMPGITDNTYPDEIIPLRNPKKSEPRLSVEVVKKVFPQEDDKPHDGENVVRNDEVKNEKADMDPKGITHLCTYGRDEEYIMNKFWQEGVQTVILWGVGDGMIPWCCLQQRIPIMCIYDRVLHKKIIEEFLLGKIIECMQKATPKDTRWWRSNEGLGCRDDEGAVGNAVKKAKTVTDTVKTVTAKAGVPKAGVPKTGVPKKGAAPGKGTKHIKSDHDDDESSSASSSSSKKPKKMKTE